MREAEKTKAVVSELISTTEVSGDSNKVVCRVNGVDGKVPGAVHKKAVGKKVKGKSFFLLSANDADDKFLVVAFATKDVDCEK